MDARGVTCSVTDRLKRSRMARVKDAGRDAVTRRRSLLRWGVFELVLAGVLLVLAAIGLSADATYGWAALILGALSGVAGASFLSVARASKSRHR